jgi:hypothetical protein
VHCDWLADDEAISYELANGLTGVGVADLIRLVGIQPSKRENPAQRYHL